MRDTRFTIFQRNFPHKNFQNISRNLRNFPNWLLDACV